MSGNKTPQKSFSLLNFSLLTIPLLAIPLVLSRTKIDISPIFLHVVYISILAYILTICLIPTIAQYTVKKGMYGLDINKKGTPAGKIKIPESLGIACGIVYLTSGAISQFWYSDDDRKLLEFNASLLCICFMILLGFVDDALDIPWRYKLLIPFIATLPLLIAYNGETTIKIPSYMVLFGGYDQLLELGYIYYLFMCLVLVFCSNAINIHAGINGLEVGQSYIIGIAILIHNILEAGDDPIGRSSHILSMFLVSPFIATSAALLYFNWYPSSVFVGDTYTMFAGMCLAVCGVMGHFSKTLILFFIPQILNFLYSVPQLFHLFGYVCPRHRLPTYNLETRLLEGRSDYLNLVNGFLCLFGPMSERDLCVLLMVFQVICCGFGLFIRYQIPDLLY